MYPLPLGQLIDGTYRIDGVISQTERAEVYAVTHVRFAEVPLALKVASLARANDFGRDTQALACLTSVSIAHMCDRGTLPDGRPYRVVNRLAGPSLGVVIAGSSFTDDRTMELMVELSAMAFEARGNGLGPLDLSVDNLMFADGAGSHLCLLRVLVADSREADPEADQAALVALRSALDRGRDAALATKWKPPTSIAELKVATEQAGGPHTPDSSEPGARIGAWRIVSTLSETMKATVYEVANDVRTTGVLKIAGPNADREQFVRDYALLAKITHPNVVRVLDTGAHEGTPFAVMAKLDGVPVARLAKPGPLPIDAALELVDQLLLGAEAIAQAGGGPLDFSLEHCYATDNPRRLVLTHPTTTHGRRLEFDRGGGGGAARATMDTWSAGVALYELIAGRLPFPVSKQSMAKVWMGIPMPLASRRRDVPLAISQLATDLISAEGRLSTRTALREELARLRLSLVEPIPERRSIEPPKAVPLLATMPSRPDPPEKPSREDWRIVVSPTRCPIAPLTAAAFRDDEIVAVSEGAVARYRRGKWSIDPAREIGSGVQRLVPIGERDYLALGNDGRLYRLRESGTFIVWGASLARYSFCGIVPHPGLVDQAILVGGSTDWGRGVIAELEGESLTILADELGVHTLHAAVYAQGDIIAVGAQGTIARLRGGAVIESANPCAVDFHVVATAGADTLVAGSHGWALRVRGAPLAIEQEAVETTTRFMCIAVDDDGSQNPGAWLGSVRGRLLRRVDRHWRRVNQPFAGDPAVLAIHAKPEKMRAVLSDGTIVLGQRFA